MSEILIGSNTDSLDATVLPQTAEEKATQLPVPVGYKILVALPEAEEKFESGLIKSDETRRIEEVLATVFFVVDLGPDCYTDKERYPTGPWCKKGDFILARPNSGTRLKIHGREFRMINEDTVDAVVQDPRGISRV
jgi:co-chaperonin GroES (HSP10)